MSMFDLTGKVALLTGASKGMGLAMATALAEHGATVVISARKQEALDSAALTRAARPPHMRFPATLATRIRFKRSWTKPTNLLVLSTS
jgi:NAD(P)-dependent dehydrogenase (short-subunit alcohol dehydrogenase family)